MIGVSERHRNNIHYYKKISGVRVTAISIRTTNTVSRVHANGGGLTLGIFWDRQELQQF